MADPQRDSTVPVTLRDLLAGEELADEQAMELGLALSEALVEAHRRGRFGVQPTDRKVLVLEDGQVQVAGLDGRQRGRQLDSGPPPPTYRAPEQWRQEETTGAAQIWALGLLLHQMIAGRHPYAELPEGELAAAVTGDEAAPLDPCFDDVAPRLSELVAACLHKDPEQRPSAQEVTRQLRELLESCRPLDPGAEERRRRRTFRRLEQLEQQRSRPRRSVLGMLVGAVVVLFLSSVHYRDFLFGGKQWGQKEDAVDAAAPRSPAPRVPGHPVQRDHKASPHTSPDAATPPPASAAPGLPPTHTPTPAPVKGAPESPYPTSTPSPATVPLPTPKNR